ncbi:MAG TPA: helix-turn-helix transcriptional regulator [Baekduia sp.]|uniref:helix-turn-helix transcriptional regulator n=1 Tax=Baekduia sp. TaxID=2600305 RepID=UPI002D797862|nr:helix-turn-helix transcriptional regulator [Baekduia sp.]HET6505225.1 helix-turn-helix transcriptional regulator [Baekduia sp.]
MDDAENRIGRFLRARRELVRPEEVGIADLGRRRVPGLRREELAMLAGVSADYYVRLEQGRDHHPSEQVLDALAGALRLDDDATAHLHELARPAPRRRHRAPARVERVRPSLQRLMDAWAQSPAHVLGCRMDVLAANPMALVLNPAQRVGTNVVRSMFLDPEFQAVHPNFERAAAGTVASLRAQVGPDLDDPLLHELVGELSLKSELFRKLWARHDVHAKTHGTKHLVHPIVGELELDYESFTVNGADGQMLIVYHAQPDTASARALALLSSMVAVSPRDGSRPLPPSARAPEPAPSGPTPDGSSR